MLVYVVCRIEDALVCLERCVQCLQHVRSPGLTHSAGAGGGRAGGGDSVDGESLAVFRGRQINGSEVRLLASMTC